MESTRKQQVNPIRLSMVLVFLSLLLASTASAQPQQGGNVLVGQAVNPQGMPIKNMQVKLWRGAEETEFKTHSHSDGWFVLDMSKVSLDKTVWTLKLERRHFSVKMVELSQETVSRLAGGEAFCIGQVKVDRRKTAAFWITLVIFAFMMFLIAATPMHNALAALLGASLLLAMSAVGHLFNTDLIVFGFGDAVSSIDWNVIFLIMGMMIVIAVVEGTGVFRWLAFFAFKKSKGKLWLLMLILMAITAVSSAILDNVTTMLLMTPITIRIALAMDIDPLVLLMPEVMAANVGGLSTMVGTPTNILIASYSGISFSQFLINLTPGVLLALGGLVGYCLFIYRKTFKEQAGQISEALHDRLEKGAVIAQPEHLKKSGWVGLGMLVLFLFGEHLHMPPAVIALMGATSLLVWIRPNVEEMIEAVDWTTLVFFLTLFMAVGALQEVGFIDLIASGAGELVGENLFLGMLVITFMAALISTVIPNIPFTATMLPVVAYLTAQIPDAPAESLYFCLAVGAAMGGNGSLIGASANLVTSGIAERSGHPISFARFFKVGFPALLITVTLAFGWLLLRYYVLG